MNTPAPNPEPIPPEHHPALQRFRPGRDLPPFFIAAVILALALMGRDWRAIGSALRQCHLPLFIAGAALFTLGHFLTNVVSFKLLFDWFQARVPLREMVKVYGASYLPQVLINSLGQLTIYIYMIRSRRLAVLPVLGLSFFYILADFMAMAVVLTIALVAKPDLDPLFFAVYGLLLAGILAGAWYFPAGGGKRLFAFIYEMTLWEALREGTAGQYAKFAAVRLVFPVFQMAGHLLALRAMGIEAPLGAVIVIVTAMTFTTFLPVSALGFGAPNFAALYLAPYTPDPASAADVAAAYGLLFQTCFLAGRILIGLPFAVPFWRMVVEPGREMGT